MEAVPRMGPGLAWYVGRQSPSNELIDVPPKPYVCAPPDRARAAARYAGHLSLLRWRDRHVFVASFVDPEQRHVYAQEIVGAEASTVGPATDAEPWAFDEARAFTRWLALGSEEEWARYAARSLPTLPPFPTALPSSPAEVYATAWLGWTDWLKEPRTAARSAESEPRAEAR